MIKKKDLKHSKPEDVLRLAKFLGLKGLNDMSHSQVCCLIVWLTSRRAKKAAGLAWHF